MIMALPHVAFKTMNNIASLLAFVFNLSLANGTRPDLLKLAKVIPIYKKDSPDLFTNYRPISLLPCISMILEKIAIWI